MASGTDGGRDYSLTELFAIAFVLGDVIIIAVWLLADPLYAFGVTALFVATFVLLWYLTGRDEGARDDDADRADERPPSERDPVTRLQERYAAGDISESEFESRLERLIDANDRAEAAGVDTADLELERSN